MVVTLLGILMLVSEVQSRKAPSPINFTLLGILILVRELQSIKVPPLIVVTLLGILMLARELHSLYLLLVDYQCYTL